MAGSELVGDRELEYLRELFEQSPAILYRYHPKGFMVARFEKEIAAFLGVPFAHAVSSGTAAIEAALYAAGVEPGDEVITTAFTFVAPVEAMLKLNARPVCVEVDETFHLRPTAVEAAITERTRCVCAVPMWGAYDVEGIRRICDQHGLILVEDAAQALGGSYRGRYLGTFGTIASFSLDFGKTLTAGEGGFVVTASEDLYRRAAEYSDHGHVHDQSVPRGQDGVRFRGFNFRMSEVTGAVAAAQLTRIHDVLRQQRARAARLKQHLRTIGGLVVRQTFDPNGETGDTVIVVLETAEQARAVAEQLLAQGIGTKILPEAFRWHYAGAWRHIWNHVGNYDVERLHEYWPETFDLLSRSVALGISLRDDPVWEEKVLGVFYRQFA